VSIEDTDSSATLARCASALTPQDDKSQTATRNTDPLICGAARSAFHQKSSTAAEAP